MRSYSKTPLFVPLLLGALALGGCQSLQSSDNFLGVITPYRLEVVQGNVITKEQAALIRPGMSRAQVRDVLGSPLLADAFHADRWDYVFSIRRQGTEPQLRRVMVLFEGDKLNKFEGANDLPAEREFVASIDSAKTSRKPPALALTDEEINALPAPQKSATAATAEAEATPPPRSYPPLEPRP
jgi:outer membrane protein assembly factor BamE